MDEEELGIVFEDEGIDKRNLDIAIEASKKFCADECPSDVQGNLIFYLYEKLTRG